MKLYRWMATCAALGVALRAAEVIPVEDFARAPAYSSMQISPDGKHLAFFRENDGRQTLFFADLETMKFGHIDPGIVADLDAPREVDWFNWIGDRRVIYSASCWDHYYFTGMWAADCDGTHIQPLSGYDANRTGGGLQSSRMIHNFDDGENVLVLDQHSDDTKNAFSDVVKLNTLTGGYKTVAKNPGNVVHWGVDHTGCVRLGITLADNLKAGCIYRDNEAASWQPLPPPDDARGEIRPLGFDYSNQKLYVAALSPKRRWSIYPFDLATGALGDAVIDDPDYDMAPITGLIPPFDGMALARSIFSRQKQTLVGVYFLTDGPSKRWFDPDFAAYQSRLDAALPGTVNLITSMTRDESRLLVLAFSDRNPGKYYIFDATTGKLTPVVSRMDWIKPELMASMYPVKYRARDGQVIHGYFTLPPGRPHKNLPLVVMPHGGPWARDVWGFDPLVQLLANRGYAVLQMNYRGSPGYGEDFYKKARHEIGRGIQDDIEDGTRWAIAAGLADPRHIAIIGASYGGYSALFALGRNPDLYRCGISIAGVADWLALIKGRDDSETKFAYQYWVQQIGDPRNDEAFLKSISPVNFADKITAPLLLIQGKEDHIVPSGQARAMIDALEKAGHSPESLFVAYEGHGFSDEKDRIKEYKAIDDFLKKNLGPGAPVQEPPPPAAPAAGKPAG